MSALGLGSLHWYLCSYSSLDMTGNSSSSYSRRSCADEFSFWSYPYILSSTRYVTEIVYLNKDLKHKKVEPKPEPKKVEAVSSSMFLSQRDSVQTVEDESNPTLFISYLYINYETTFLLGATTNNF